MIKVPVTLGFDENKIIGMCELDESRLPPKPNWHLALGYLKLIAADNYSLTTFGVTDDHKFKPLEEQVPIPMVLHCPRCHDQHIDEADKPKRTFACCHREDTCCVACERMNKGLWTNPPHKSHLCHTCGCIWRPADVCTTGVVGIMTAGARDTWPQVSAAAPSVQQLSDSNQSEFD